MPNTFKSIVDEINRREVYQIREELILRIDGVISLMRQHDELTRVANDKAQETLNERLGKMNEFREQQKDIMNRFATVVSLDGLSTRFEDNIKTVTARYEANIITLTQKIDTIKNHQDEKVEIMKKALDDKRDTLYAGILEMFKNIENKADGNLKSEIEKFSSTDRQIQVLINTNAEISNRGIGACEHRIMELFELKNKQEGSLTVLKWLLSVVITIVIALVIGFLTKHI